MLEALLVPGCRDTNECARVLRQFRRELRAHAVIEEQVLYPALEAAIDPHLYQTLVADERETMRVMQNLLLPDLEDGELYGLGFQSRVRLLKGLIESHVDQQEQDVFAAARRAIEAQHRPGSTRRSSRKSAPRPLRALP